MSTLVARLSDAVNPIVVKEVRQGLRTRVFWICFSLMLLACVTIALVAFASTQDKGVNQDGAYYFFAFFFCVGVAQFFIIPYSAYRSLAREREDETWVLLTLTGLGPRRILRGKLGSYLVQSALYGSAAGPFLLFSYYLNGIDLPTIGILVSLGVVYTLFLTAVSVCMASLAESRVFRALLHFALLGGLLMAGGMAVGATTGILAGGNQLMKKNEFWWVLGCSFWAMLSYGFILFEAAASRMSLLTENYARGPRLALLLQMLGSLGVFAWIWSNNSYDVEILLAAQIIFMLNLAGVGLFIATDYDGQTAAQRTKTNVFSLLRPGALRGFRFVMLLTGAVTLAFALLSPMAKGSHTINLHAVYAIIACGAYVVLYLSLPIILTRAIYHYNFSTPGVGRLLFVFILIAASGAPPLLSLILGGEGSDPIINLFNPIVGMVKFAESVKPWNDVRVMGFEDVLVLSAVAVIAAIIADRVLSLRDDRTL